MIRNCYFLLLLMLVQCTRVTEEQVMRKIDGISLEASKELIDSIELTNVVGIGAEWVALIPYGFIRREEGIVHFNSEHQWIGERVDGIEEDIESCRKSGLHIMLKPHVWVSKGAYTGNYTPDSTNWDLLESSYSAYILTFARLAQKKHVELFCIGTEWREFIKERPKYWSQLIDSIRKVYSGKLTYAANWDEYKETPFWDRLDYIGVNAYFPLTDKLHPSKEDLHLGWNPVAQQLKSISHRFDKPILLTEYGYRSVVGTTIKPWESYTELPESKTEQEQALKVLYQSLWEESWMAGGFLWKWHTKPPHWRHNRATDYTPQHKPAEEVVKKWYMQ